MNTPQNNETSNARCGIRRCPIKSVIVTFMIFMILPLQAFAQNDPTEHILACQKAMTNGDFNEAQLYCDLAREISPNDPKYLAIHEQLRKEIKSKDALEEVLEALSNGECRDATDALYNIQKGTIAYEKMIAKNYKAKAYECFEKKLRDLALAAIDNGEISAAERIRDEIKSQSLTNMSGMYIAQIDDAIRKANSMPSSAPTPAPAPSVDVDDLCTEALKAKFLGSDIAYRCKAYNLYKQAKETGIKDPTCQKAADAHIAAYASKCDSAPTPTPMPSAASMPEPSDDIDELCNEAVKAKLQKNSCKAYNLYKQAKKAGIKNPICQKAADKHIAAYASKCN